MELSVKPTVQQSGAQASQEVNIANLSDVVMRREGVISCNVAAETVLLDINSGIYFGLDPVGTSIWTIIEVPRSIREIRDALLNEYDVGADACAAAVLRLAKAMAAKGLVTVVEG